MPQQQANRLFRPRSSESPLYPFQVLEDYEIKPGEVRRFGGFPLARTDDGWQVVEHVDLRGVVDLED